MLVNVFGMLRYLDTVEQNFAFTVCIGWKNVKIIFVLFCFVFALIVVGRLQHAMDGFLSRLCCLPYYYSCCTTNEWYKSFHIDTQDTELFSLIQGICVRIICNHDHLELPGIGNCWPDSCYPGSCSLITLRNHGVVGHSPNSTKKLA